MTVLTEQSSRSFSGNDVQTEFPTGFRFLSNAHLTVIVTTADEIETELTEGVGYTVDGVGDADGGTITTTDPVASGSTLYVERNTPILQEVSLRSQGTFSPAVHEEMLDRLTMIAQEDRRRLAALESLPGLVNVEDVSIGNSSAFEFVTNADAVEDGFPIAVAIGGGLQPTDVWCTSLENLDDPAESFDECPAIQWSSSGIDDLSLLRVDGLKPGTNYSIRLMWLAL